MAGAQQGIDKCLSLLCTNFLKTCQHWPSLEISVKALLYKERIHEAEFLSEQVPHFHLPFHTDLELLGANKSRPLAFPHKSIFFL